MKGLISSIFILLVSSTYAAYLDSGFIEWEQPNGVTFTARCWGDEFFNWMETQEGYRIVQGTDKYYYYAILDENGEFAPSTDTVEINSPLAASYQLERTASRIEEIENEITIFNEQVAENAELVCPKKK